MNAADLEPIPEEQKTQSSLDLFLIFAGANVVATTFITGAVLKAGLSFQNAIGAAVLGSVVGALLVALLVPVGSKWSVPSIVALRAPLGRPGAHLVAILLYVTNFAWIALNNVIAASAGVVILPFVDVRILAVILGVVATLIVAGGPRLVAEANRAAVPLMLVAGVILAFLALGIAGSVPEASAVPPTPMWLALDLVIAYQVSWILMFADYSRYGPSPRRSGLAVFASLSLTSILGMSLGALLGAVSGSTDPGAMLAALGSPPLGAALLAVATITTNFVNIYLSAIALRSLVPRIKDAPAVLITGLIGAALSVLSREWIDGYSAFMGVLGLILVPLGGVALAQFFPFPRQIEPRELYDALGRFARPGWAGLISWGAGALVYWRFQTTGATLPSLLVSFAIFALFRRGRLVATERKQDAPGQEARGL